MNLLYPDKFRYITFRIPLQEVIQNPRLAQSLEFGLYTSPIFFHLYSIMIHSTGGITHSYRRLMKYPCPSTTIQGSYVNL